MRYTVKGATSRFWNVPGAIYYVGGSESNFILFYVAMGVPHRFK